MVVKKSSFFMECLPDQRWVGKVRDGVPGKDESNSNHLECL
jgi:hypothetical protein